MKNLNNVAEDLFNKIRGRFPSVTIGNEEGTITTVPKESRFYDFTFMADGVDAGKVSVSLDEENGVTVIVGKDIVEHQDPNIKSVWFNFLRELRQFAKKRMLQFDVRDITKSNLQKRDYKHLAATRPGEETMAESKMYGTHKTSYQRIGNARLAIKHTAPINTESSTGRTQKIGSIFIESPEGEKFRYPYRHLSGARAMARHVSEGGNAYDDFGKYISSLSEEMSKLRKFNTYMSRSGVMAETLSEYTDVVKERTNTIRKEIQNLQKENYYKEAVDGFSAPIVEEVPEDVAENWIDQLTIKQFNEELKDVFPYIYRLVGEATKASVINPEDLEESDPCWKGYKQVGMKKKGGKDVPNCVPESEEVVEDVYRGQKKFKMAIDNHKNFKVYVTKERSIKNRYLATAVSNTSGKEPEGVKSLGRTAQEAVQQVVQKLDSRVEKAQKVTSDATLDFNVMFTRDLLTNDAEDLGIENINDIYVRIVPGPKLHVANMIVWDTIRELLPKEKFSKSAKRTEGGSPLIGARLSAAQAREANVVANGRYILGTPKPVNDESISDEGFAYYEYDMSFESIVVDKNEKVSFNKPAVTVGTRRTESAYESEIEEYYNNLLGEFGDQELDEISKKKLGDYIKGASHDYKLSALDYMDAHRKGDDEESSKQVRRGRNRGVGIQKAVNRLSKESNYPDDMNWSALDGDDDVEAAFDEAKQEILYNVKNYDENILRDLANPSYYDKEQVDDELSDLASELVTDFVDGRFEPSIADAISGDLHVYAKKLLYKKFQSVNQKESGTELPKPEKPKTPLGEFILSYFDRETGKFPKGETAVLTAVEKDYGDHFVEPARQFIEQLNAKALEHIQQQAQQSRYPETEMIKRLAGV